MDRASLIVLAVLAILVIVAAIFYTNAGENHRSVAIGLCEIECQNVTASSNTYNNFCAAKNISYGYSCAISQTENSSICGNQATIYVNNNCQLVSVG